MDLRALIAKMDKIESKQILNEAITMKDIQAAVGQEKDEQKRAVILNDLAWKENLPGLYDPISGYFIRKQQPSRGDDGRISIAATAREADTQELAKMGLVPSTAKTSALGGIIGTGKNSWLGLDKEQDAANDKASRDVKQQSANIQGGQSSDAFYAPRIARLKELIAKISSPMESISFNGEIARKLVESFSYELYEKATLGTGSVVQKDIGNGMTISTGRYQSEVAEINKIISELGNTDELPPEVAQVVQSAQEAITKLTPATSYTAQAPTASASAPARSTAFNAAKDSQRANVTALSTELRAIIDATEKLGPNATPDDFRPLFDRLKKVQTDAAGAGEDVKSAVQAMVTKVEAELKKASGGAAAGTAADPNAAKSPYAGVKWAYAPGDGTVAGSAKMAADAAADPRDGAAMRNNAAATSRDKKSTGPSGTQVQTDDDGNHMITTPDGKTMVVGPDGKPLPNGGKVTPAKPTDNPTDKPTNKLTGAGKVGPANPGTKAIQHYLNTKHGQKLDVDGRDGPLTTAAIRSLSGKVSTDEYKNIAGLGFAYNVLPGQGPGTVSLGNPEFVKRMTALGYDPKTGNPVGGAKPTAGSGQSASPAGTVGPKVNTTNTAELENSIKAIEAILAKNKTKSESIHPDDALVLENISNFTLQEQMEIWSLLVEAGPRTAAQQASMQAAATGVNPPNNPFGLTPDRAAPTSNTGKLAKFTSKLGGASGIGRKIAARAGASALAGPAALIVGAGMAAWTAYEVGKALYDTFKDDELPSMDPADQEAIKKHMAVILQYQKNTDMMAQLPPELKTRLEGALKGLDKIAATADTDTDTDIPSRAGAGIGAAAAKTKQVAGSAVDSTVAAGNRFAAGVKQGYNQQAASPAASQSTSTKSNQSVSGTMKMGKPEGPIEFNGKTVNPGDPAYPEAAAALIKAQGNASRERNRAGTSTGPVSAGAPNVDKSTFEATKSEDDEILERIRSAFRF